MIPLSRKLIVSNVATIAVSLGLLGILSFRGLNELSSKMMSLNEESSKVARENLQSLSGESISKIAQIFKEGMQRKGRDMIDKDSATVLPMMEDNAFLQLRDFLKKNKKRDPDLVLASFFVVEQGDVKAWQYVSTAHPEGLEVPIIYNEKKRVWQAKDSKGKRVEIPAPEVSILQNSDDAVVQEREIDLTDANGKTTRRKVMDCYVPINKKGRGAVIAASRKRGEAIGYLRYVLSLQKMEEVIASQTGVAEKKLSQLKEENEKSLKEARDVGSNQLTHSVLILGLFGGLLVMGAIAYATVFSRKITGPIKRLKEYAEEMAQGHYRQTINVTTDDEIGVLANSFQEMSNAICKRDEELAEINKNLEKLVEERTQQLKEELKKISNLLNNMKQSVFTVNNSMLVIPPVSKFSETIFGGAIEGKNVLDTLYSDVERKGEQFASLNTALACVFGETDLQWDLMEDNLPKRLQRNDGKVLKIAYNPLWDDAGNLEKIMYVVEDITALEELEKQVSAEREASAARIQILQELGSNDPDAVREYFSGAIRMAEETLDQLKKVGSDPEAMVIILRNLHTIKGNSRLFNLSRVAGVTHHVENFAVDLNTHLKAGKKADALEVREGISHLLDGMGDIQKQIQDYATFAQQVFRIENQFERSQYQQLHDILVSAHEQLDKSQLERVSRIAQSLNLGGAQTAAKAASMTGGKGSGAFALSRESVRAQLGSNFLRTYPKTASFWVPVYLNFVAYIKAAQDLAAQTRSLDHLLAVVTESRLIYLKELVTALFSEMRAKAQDSTKIKGLEKEIAQYLGIVFRINTLEVRRRYPQLDNVWEKLQKDLESAKSSDASKKVVAEFQPETLLTSVLKATARRGWAPMEVVSALGLNLGQTLGPKQRAKEEYVDVLARLEAGEEVKNTHFSDWFGTSYVRMVDLGLMLRGYVGSEELPGDASGAQMVLVLDSNLAKLKSAVDEQGVEELKRAVIRLTEVPLRPVLKKYRNMVRDLSSRLGKKVSLKVGGDEITLPKDTLYGVEDALVHLIRNALDHGVETPEERKAVGKPPEGTLMIEMNERESKVVLEIKDDGKGIDPDIIAKKCIEKGLIKSAEVAKMTQEQKLSLIFMQNFSTKDEVSEISGRGVGMDIVKSSIERIGGKLTLKSEKGLGTTFTIEFSV